MREGARVWVSMSALKTATEFECVWVRVIMRVSVGERKKERERAPV